MTTKNSRSKEVATWKRPEDLTDEQNDQLVESWMENLKNRQQMKTKHPELTLLNNITHVVLTEDEIRQQLDILKQAMHKLGDVLAEVLKENDRLTLQYRIREEMINEERLYRRRSEEREQKILEETMLRMSELQLTKWYKRFTKKYRTKQKQVQRLIYQYTT